MEELTHMTHDHPLILTKHENTTSLRIACFGCRDTIWPGTSVYRCSRTHGASTSTLASSCVKFYLHKACSEVPPHIHDPTHEDEGHLLTLHLNGKDDLGGENGAICTKCKNVRRFVYRCEQYDYIFCLNCSMQERKLNHRLHRHSLTLLPLKSDFTCGACGKDGTKEYSYLCQTCLFWIHKSCALAPKDLMHKLHHHEHPLLLSGSIPKRYNRSRLVCSICGLKFHESYWLYYCSDCRYFAHVKCATKPIDATEVDEEEDLTLVQFPVCDDEHYLYYNLIQEFARSCTSTDKDKSPIDGGISHRKSGHGGISHCQSGHPLVRIKEVTRNENIELINKLVCKGCFQPLSFSTDSLYGCGDCNYYLHKVCSTELPKALKHPSHPEHVLLRCQHIAKFSAGRCDICDNPCRGIYFSCGTSSCSFLMDILCASLPRKIKHESHKHSLQQVEQWEESCNGCKMSPKYGCFYSCNICRYRLHVGCATSQGTVKHRWDEHRLRLMYPPVKHHPHDFDCEFCSKDINPNYWFYHCQECDLSFHLECIKIGNLLANFNRYNLRFPDCNIL